MEPSRPVLGGFFLGLRQTRTDSVAAALLAVQGKVVYVRVSTSSLARGVRLRWQLGVMCLTLRTAEA